MNLMQEIFSYPFMVRAFLVGTLIALCASLLGVSLVLKRYSLIGEGLSNVGFGALAVATALNRSPLTVSIPVVVIAAILLLRVSENSKIKGDAAIALLSTSSLTLGVIIISITTGMNTDVCNYLFGSILSMAKSDVRLSIILSLVVIVLFILFYQRIFIVTFDESFAKATGVKSEVWNLLIAVLTALVIVLGMRMMGALLITSLIVFPSLSSMRLCKRFKTVILNAAGISVICLWVGLTISYAYALPSGASVVLCNMITFVIYFSLSKILQHRKVKGKSLIHLAVLVLTMAFLTSCQGNTGSGYSIKKADSSKNAAAIKDQEIEDLLAQPSFTYDTNENMPSANATQLQEAGSPSSPLHDKAAALSNEVGKDGDTIHIDDKIFLTQINDIFMNFEDYKDKTIIVEGMYAELYSTEDNSLPAVIRLGAGCSCCGNDGWGGFLLHYEDFEEIPQEGDWMRVTGKPYIEKTEAGFSNLFLKVSSIELNIEAGQETVYQ